MQIARRPWIPSERFDLVPKTLSPRDRYICISKGRFESISPVLWGKSLSYSKTFFCTLTKKLQQIEHNCIWENIFMKKLMLPLPQKED